MDALTRNKEDCHECTALDTLRYSVDILANYELIVQSVLRVDRVENGIASSVLRGP